MPSFSDAPPFPGESAFFTSVSEPGDCAFFPGGKAQLRQKGNIAKKSEKTLPTRQFFRLL
jgi:hypothetical protein